GWLEPDADLPDLVLQHRYRRQRRHRRDGHRYHFQALRSAAMAFLRNKVTVVAAIGMLGVGGWYLSTVLAAQHQGALAQAPLNDQVQVPPAFIMAVDDSNSMTFERIFPGGDGRLQWNSGNSSFFNSNGAFYNVGSACATNSADCYLYLFPHSGFNSSYSPGDAIPPLDAFGFARSHQFNAGYYNPEETYEPWRRANGSL